MHKQRYVNTKFWNDNFIINLTPDEKVLFLYFLTSPLSSICGVYECPLKIIGAHTGFDPEVIEKMIKRFEGKIYYIDGWVYIRKFVTYQSSENTKIKKGIDADLAKVPPKVKKKIQELEKMTFEDDGFKLFEPEKVDEEVKKEKQKQQEIRENIQFVFEYYRSKIQPKGLLTEKGKDKAKARLKEFTVDELVQAIDNFSKDEWWMKHNSKRGFQWFLHSQERILQFLELQPRKSKVYKA